ncbi:aquaporin-like protein [Amylocystis lapponica]|nr:aquaporin-like protein [Amylocystis lapponica]
MPILPYRLWRFNRQNTQSTEADAGTLAASAATPAPARPVLSPRRSDFMAALLEYIGTTVFLTLAYGGTQAAQGENYASASTSSDIERVMYIALSFGFSLLVSAWLFFRVTGGLFNPNVSLALLLTGIIGPVRFVLYCIAQLLGGITAAALILALTPGPLASNTFLQPGINSAQGVFIEMFITSFLVIAVLMLAAEKHNTTPFAPVGIGLTLFVCHLWAIFYTGCGMNTARSFGPAVVTGFPYGSQWVYWVGPCLGSFLGAGFYALLKQYAPGIWLLRCAHLLPFSFQYWRLNPGQDTVVHSASPPDPLKAVKTVVRRSASRGSGSRRENGGPNNGSLEQNARRVSSTEGGGGATRVRYDAHNGSRRRSSALIRLKP